MLSLLRAEVRRLTSRRLARLLALLALGIVLLVQGREFLLSNRDVAAARRRAVAEAQRQGARFGCEQAKAVDKLPPDFPCEQFRQPEMDANNFFHDPRLLSRDRLPQGARGVTAGLAIAAFLVGASFIGAEWNAGTLQALLFWEPRRPRVLLAKAVALVAVVVGFALALHAFVYGTTYLTAATRGSTAGTTAGLRLSVLLTILRGLLVVSVTGLLGYAIAGLARVTGAALGVAFVYFVIVENLVRGLRPGWQRFLVSENVVAIQLKHLDVATAHARTIDLGLFRPYRLSGVRGAVTLGVYLAVLLGAFAVTFTRRDVT